MKSTFWLELTNPPCGHYTWVFFLWFESDTEGITGENVLRLSAPRRADVPPITPYQSKTELQCYFINEESLFIRLRASKLWSPALVLTTVVLYHLDFPSLFGKSTGNLISKTVHESRCSVCLV